MAYLAANLYAQFCATMPIVCVDLLVTDLQGRVLLLKRGNEPAKGQWWTPGGRIVFGELRIQAARRKLLEETGLQPVAIHEAGSYDVLLPYPAPPQEAQTNVAPSLTLHGAQRIGGEDALNMRLSHGVTTLFHMPIRDTGSLRVDGRHTSHAWRLPQEWLRESLHPFVQHAVAIAALKQYAASSGLQELSHCPDDGM